MKIFIALFYLAIFLINIDAQNSTRRPEGSTTPSTTLCVCTTPSVTTPSRTSVTTSSRPSVTTTTPSTSTGSTTPSIPSCCTTPSPTTPSPQRPSTTTPSPDRPRTPTRPRSPTWPTPPTRPIFVPPCPGGVKYPRCSGRRNEGRWNGTDCPGANRNMWYYNRRSRSCRQMAYKGCGGNNNRFCKRSQCELRCRRRG